MLSVDYLEYCQPNIAAVRPLGRLSVAGEAGTLVSGQGAGTMCPRLGSHDAHRSPDRLSRRCFAADGSADGFSGQKDLVTFRTCRRFWVIQVESTRAGWVSRCGRG